MNINETILHFITDLRSTMKINPIEHNMLSIEDKFIFWEIRDMIHLLEKLMERFVCSKSEAI